MEEEGPYRLVQSLHAHDGPIRSITIGPNGEVVTGCQSNSPHIRGWNPVDYSESFSPIFHDHWVTALGSLPADSSRSLFPAGCIVTGCMDKKVRVFDGQSRELIAVLEGHSKGIISFSWTSDGKLISGSWDGTAIVWDLTTHQIVHTLSGHENGVHVLGLSNGLVATTSTGESVNGKPANFRLRFWNVSSGQQIGDSISDHMGSIRAISGVPGIGGFATSSNDGTVILRSIDGVVIGTMYHPAQEDGSPPFVLDVSAIHTDSGLDIVSGAEDGSVMVWSGTEKVQFIPHPSCVWCVMGLPNTGGDFLTGSHDGVLRLFSRNPDKYNSTSAVQAHLEFAMEVSAAKEQKRKGPTNEEIAKAPKWENRGALPGTSENQVMVFNDKGTMIAAQWNSGSWIMVGNVTGTGDGGSINGVYYDHVMPVEIETPNGLRNLNLGHNNGENPFDAAQRFIDQNELSQGYLQQIADWIIARSGQSAPTLGMDDSSTKMDVQSSYSAPKAFSFRSDGYFAYDDIPQTNKVYGKVVEFNGSMEGNNKLSDRNLELLSSLITVLENKSHYVTSEVSKEHIIAVLAMVNWDIDKLFPMFDLFRLIAVHPKGSSTLSSIPQLSVVINKIAKLSRQREAFTTASALTASKFLVNLFRNDELRNTVLRNNLLSQTVLDIVNTLVLHSSKLVRLAVSTFILNLSTVTSHYGLFSLRLSIEMMDSVFSNASQLLQYENDSVETIFRALKAVGTMKFNLESEMDIYSSRYNLSSILFATKDKWSNTGKMDEVVLSCLNEVSVLFP